MFIALKNNKPRRGLEERTWTLPFPRKVDFRCSKPASKMIRCKEL